MVVDRGRLICELLARFCLEMHLKRGGQEGRQHART